MCCMVLATNKYSLLLKIRLSQCFWSSRGGLRSQIPNLADSATLLIPKHLNVQREVAAKLVGVSFVCSGILIFSLVISYSCVSPVPPAVSFGPWGRF